MTKLRTVFKLNASMENMKIEGMSDGKRVYTDVKGLGLKIYYETTFMSFLTFFHGNGAKFCHK